MLSAGACLFSWCQQTCYRVTEVLLVHASASLETGIYRISMQRKIYQNDRISEKPYIFVGVKLAYCQLSTHIMAH
jgi:hypothetical protein